MSWLPVDQWAKLEVFAFWTKLKGRWPTHSQRHINQWNDGYGLCLIYTVVSPTVHKMKLLKRSYTYVPVTAIESDRNMPEFTAEDQRRITKLERQVTMLLELNAVDAGIQQIVYDRLNTLDDAVFGVDHDQS